jgi:NAD-dependent deacetylase
MRGPALGLLEFAGILNRFRLRIVPSTLYGHKSFCDSVSDSPLRQETRALTNQKMSSGSGQQDPALAALIELSQPALAMTAFTGAGMSTESGIPDYRGPGGVWERNAPPTLKDFRQNAETRRQYWMERRTRYPSLRDRQPNAGHVALGRLQSAGRMTDVITQNIDGLHQKAGGDPERIIELHGTAHRVRCLDCGASWPAEEIQARLETELVPTCEVCGGMLRAATVLFGEALPEVALRRAFVSAQASDLMLVIGSSLVVQPAARIPEIAVASGARLAIINNDPTPLDDLADVIVRASAGAVLSALADALLVGSQDTLAGSGWQTGQK